MSKLLKLDGRLVKQNGKLVRTDDPAACECCGPPPPPVKYICATREDSCGQFPLNYGQWQYNSFGQWVIRRSRCAGQVPADTCTIADPPSRPGFPGEIVNVGCKAVAPITTKECITEEEFNKGGWVNVSGPHDTIEQCEASCNPPPPEYTTPGWYAQCVAATDGGLTITYSQRLVTYYSSPPNFPIDLGDRDYAVAILAGPFASTQETEMWIEASGGQYEPCATVGDTIRPTSDNPLP
jgi:hypothetical protein